MRKSLALLGMATAMMAAATTAPHAPHDFGETLSYSGGSSHQSKYRRDKMDPIKAERIAKTKRKAARKARKNNRRK